MDADHHRFGAAFVFGLVLIASGLSSLLERARVFEAITVGHWWPLVILAFALAKFSTGDPGDRRRGWVLLTIGIWGLAIALTPLTLSDTWPVALLVWGGSMILTSERDQPLPCGEEQSHVG